MDAALPSNPRRAGALWVAGTGAFLLLAAAAVFVAVSWDQLPDGLKLAIIAGLTGGFLVGGRALERTLPATGSVLFHLGAFLLPIDVAAVAVRVDLGWRGLLLAEGILGVIAWPALARLSSSVVLRRGAMLGVPVLAAGVAALSPVPAPLLLAAAALAAIAGGRRDESLVWATGAGLAPLGGVAVASLVAAWGMPGDGVLRELGLAASAAGLLAVAAGIASSAVLAVEARRRDELGLAVVAAIVALTSAATTWGAAEISGRSTVLALPALLLLIEIGALLAERDLFWARPVRKLAFGVEVVAGLCTVPVAAGLLLAGPFIETGFLSDSPLLRPDLVAGSSLGVLALAWVVIAMRGRLPAGSRFDWTSARRGLDHVVATPMAALAAVVAVEVASASAVATAAALVGAAAASSLSRRATARALTGAMVIWAPVVAWPEPGAALLAGLVGGVVCAHAALTQRRLGGLLAGQAALASTGALAATIGAALAADALGPVAAMAVAAGAIWVVGLVADRASVWAGHGARVVLVLPVVAAADASGGVRSIPALVAAAVLIGDAVRLDRPALGHGAAAAGLAAAVLAGMDAGFALDEVGLGLCIAAVVVAGLGALVTPRWSPAFMTAAVAAAGTGTMLAATEARSFMTALITVGGLVLAAALADDEPVVAHIGGAIAAGGVIGHLLLSDVQMSEAYLAPVCAQLVVMGWHLRRTRVLSSWAAYAPAVGLFGLAAVAERAAGGGPGHALAAAAVGASAVAVGGWRRLAGPLFTGTAVLVTVTAVDVLASLGQVPPWIWLAVAGSALLGAGVALEQTDTSPADAGRRVVEVIAERFD